MSKVPEGFDLDKAIAKNIGKRPPTAEEKYTLGSFAIFITFGLVVVVLHVLIVEPILASVSRFHCRILRVSRLRPSQTGLALHLTKRRRFGGHIGERMPPDQGAERCSAHESPSEHPEPCRWNVDEHDFHRCDADNRRALGTP
jgi:hypothetical protein